MTHTFTIDDASIKSPGSIPATTKVAATESATARNSSTSARDTSNPPRRR